MLKLSRLVKPDATPDEVAAVVESQRGDQIFEQAVRPLSILTAIKGLIEEQLLDSNRYGESRAAYREVQHRHEDIQKIERTLEELGQLFLDVGPSSVPIQLRRMNNNADGHPGGPS